MRAKIWMLGLFSCWLLGGMIASAQHVEGLVPRFERPTSRLVLHDLRRLGRFWMS